MRLMYVLTVFFLGLTACKKAAYLTDDGLHTPEVNMSTYDYLASHPHHMFDTLIMMIDHFDLKDEVNNAKTFWVPTDYSINKFIKLKESQLQELNENATYKFSDLLQDLPLDSLKAYFSYNTPYSLNNAYTNYVLLDNDTGISGFAYHKQLQPIVQWSYQDIFYLYYINVRGEVDQTTAEGIPRIDRNDPADVRVLCQTTGIKTNTGTVLNVLSNLHTFVSDFYQTGDTGPLVEDLEDGGLRFTFSVDFKPLASYESKPFTVSGEWIAETFGIESTDIPGMIGNDITFGAIEPNGTFNTTSTANAPGHWFGADGSVVTWGADARLFSEYNANTFTFNIGQYPSRSAIGDTYKIKQAMEYTNRLNKTLRIEFVFNISIK